MRGVSHPVNTQIKEPKNKWNVVYFSKLDVLPTCVKRSFQKQAENDKNENDFLASLNANPDPNSFPTPLSPT